jgi:phosphoglycolate phosphatase-like HAD superfamily hydrolase
MAKIEAVVFDIDGTLLDTREFISQAYEHVLEDHGMPARTREEIASQIGKKLHDCYAFLAPNGNHEQMAIDHHNFQEANLALVRAFDYVEEVMENLKQKGIKTALWTGRKGNVIASLEQAQVEPDAFDCIVDADMYNEGKPSSEGLFIVLGKLGVEADKTVMVGDAGVDIEAGHNAGVASTIGITHGFGTREELEAAKADYILDSLETLPEVIGSISNGF